MSVLTKFIKNQRGDTIVEVMLATVIMSVVVASSFTLVNRASRINQVSSERSDAVNAMQSQAELLRFYRNTSEDSVVWDSSIVAIAQTNSAPTPNACEDFLAGAVSGPSASASAFYFNDSQALTSFTPASGSNVGRYYVWIEGYKSTSAPNNDYVDFFIHSCWQGPGGTGPQKASLIYRLAI